jgi:hypothetical protein
MEEIVIITFMQCTKFDKSNRYSVCFCCEQWTVDSGL